MFAVTATIPILRIFSIEKATEFYVQYLGMKLDWTHGDGPPRYMQVSGFGLTLHLSEHHGDATPGSTVYISCQNLPDFHRQLQSKNYAYLNPGLENSPWGSRCTELTDPFGNRLRFDQFKD